MKSAVEGFTPIRYAFVVALVYALFGAAWITGSGHLAESVASSVEDLAAIERVKGIGFVIATTLLLFIFSYFAFRKMANAAVKLLHNQQQLVQAERDSISALVSSSIAHDSVNLLTVMRLNTERLRTLKGLPETAIDSLDRLDRGVTRMTELTARMRGAGRQITSEKPRLFSLNEAIDEALSLLQMHQAVRNCQIEVVAAPGLEARGYPILIHQVLMNLVLNAAEAVEGNGKILIRAWRLPETTFLEVHDNGPGVPPELRSRIFDTFFTTKNTGTGLGLLSVRSCVEVHKGKLNVDQSALGGALFQLVLPDLGELERSPDKFAESLNKATSMQTPLELR